MQKMNFGKLANYFWSAQNARKVLPVIMQNHLTNEVYTLAYADREALSQTLKSGIATFWSTSRNELWIKGLTSGNIFRVVEVLADCENNSLIYRVIPLNGGACHCVDETGEKYFSCFRRKLEKGGRK